MSFQYEAVQSSHNAWDRVSGFSLKIVYLGLGLCGTNLRLRALAGRLLEDLLQPR